ncbi:MAG: hypothetical protein Q4G66_11560, partial [bacterium]|nr:hypothetical protein [bacterium]
GNHREAILARWASGHNNAHHHSTLAGFTPQQVFIGQHLEIAKVRQAALDEAFTKHPERCSRGRSKVQMPPVEVCINPVPADADQETLEKGVNSQPYKELLKSNLIFKVLVQIRLTCSGVFMTPFSQTLEPPTIPGRFTLYRTWWVI